MKMTKKNIYRTVFIASFVVNLFVFVLVSTPLVNRLYAHLEIAPEIKKAGAIVLLSSGYHTEDILDQNSFQRMQHALRFYKNGYADKIIVCGGVIKKGDPPVSVVIKKAMLEMGVDEKDVITEELSKDTYENISYAWQIMNSMGIEKPLLVTSSSHMFRSLAVCKKRGLNAYPAPVPCFEKNVSGVFSRMRLIPEILREHLAIAYYWLKGRI